MHCPYCQLILSEESVQCDACGLDLVKLDGVLGIPPVLQAGLTDQEGSLTRAEAREVRGALANFRERFPQIQLALLLQKAPVVVPMRTWAWWLFNRSQFSLALDKGFVNRDILLVIDPVRRSAVITIGYGLEPFAGRKELGRALGAGEAALKSGHIGEACGQILIALDQTLRQIIGSMPQAYGVPAALLTPQEADVPAVHTW